MTTDISHLPPWLAPYRGHRLTSVFATVSEGDWILQPLQYAVEVYEESRLTDPWYATQNCLDAIRSGSIALFALRRVAEPTLHASVLMWTFEPSPLDDESPWIEVIGEGGEVLTAEFFRTAIDLLHKSFDEAPIRDRYPERRAAELDLPEEMPTEPPWHALLEPLTIQIVEAGGARSEKDASMNASSASKTPTPSQLFEVYRLMVGAQEALYAGGEPLLTARMSDLDRRIEQLTPSSSNAITELAKVLANLGDANATSATSAVIALRLIERVSSELESALSSYTTLPRTPFPETPFNDPTRHAVRDLMLFLWGQCSAKVPDYDKNSWNAVCGQLKQIGAIDW